VNFFCDVEVEGRLSDVPLSMALVSDDGCEFYVELTPSDDLTVDAFAREQVLPQFGRIANAGVADLGAMSSRLADFMAEFPGRHKLVYEQQGTWLCVRRAMLAAPDGAGLLERLDGAEVSANVRGAVCTMAAERSYSKDPLQRLKPNHSLADARALRAKWQALARENSVLQNTASMRLAGNFLAGLGYDHTGRSLGEILAWPDDRLETTDDYVQWLFPLPEPSPLNPHAPAPTLDEFAMLARDDAVRAGVGLAARRMLRFLGFDYDGFRPVKADNWPQRSANWVAWPTVRDRYISRMLRSASLLGLHDEATRVLGVLEEVLPHYRGDASSGALNYWRAAVCGPR
jgi:hypothetical protein